MIRPFVNHFSLRSTLITVWMLYELIWLFENISFYFTYYNNSIQVIHQKLDSFGTCFITNRWLAHIESYNIWLDGSNGILTYLLRLNRFDPFNFNCSMTSTYTQSQSMVMTCLNHDHQECIQQRTIRPWPLYEFITWTRNLCMAYNNVEKKLHIAYIQLRRFYLHLPWKTF